MNKAAVRSPKTRWAVTRQLCMLLRGGLTEEPVADFPAEDSWEPLIEAASYHLVTPSLSYAVRGRSFVPFRASEYLDGVLYLNRERNEVMSGTLARALAALNANGIEPVLLKGMAAIVSGLYPDSAMRIVGDIDLLVPESDAERAVQSLCAQGFETYGGDDKQYVGHHHLPPLRDLASGVFVELHTQPVIRQWQGLIDYRSIIERAEKIGIAGHAAILPDPASRVVHAIVHSELSDLHHEQRRLDIRQMLELAALCRRYAGAVDWQSVRGTFEKAGKLGVLLDSLDAAETLFGVPLGDGLVRPSRRRVAMLQREAERSDLFWLVRRRLQILRDQPETVLNLLKPRSLGRVASAVKRELRKERW